MLYASGQMIDHKNCIPSYYIKLETYEFFVTFNFIIKKWYTALMFNFYKLMSTVLDEREHSILWIRQF